MSPEPAARCYACRCLACEAQWAAQLYGSGLSVALRRSRRLDKALKAAEVREAAELAEVERFSLLEFEQAECALDQCFDLDTRVAYEASGQMEVVRQQPEWLQKMLTGRARCLHGLIGSELSFSMPG